MGRMARLWRLVGARVRLLFFGASREDRAIVQWRAEHARVRDAVDRFIGAGLEAALERPIGRQSVDGVPIVIAQISRAEWLLLLDRTYGPSHPKTLRHKRALLGVSGGPETPPE